MSLFKRLAASAAVTTTLLIAPVASITGLPASQAGGAVDCDQGADNLSAKGAPVDEVAQWYVDCLQLSGKVK